jgi:hypothetical protein
VTYSDVQGGWTGDGNINSDPKFTDPSGWNYRLHCSSLCLNAADNDAVGTDFEDVNEDGEDTGVVERDRALRPRIDSTSPDMGAFERHNCPGDIDQNGRLDIDDILAIVNGWGSCPGGGAPCPADIHPSVCSGNGSVDIDDLLQVINAWGDSYPNGCAEPEEIDVGELESVTDCMDAATEKELTPFSPEWIEAVNACAEALCAAEIILCD